VLPKKPVLDDLSRDRRQGVTQKTLSGGGWSTANLGGAVITGVAPITIGSEFASTWIFAAGGNTAVYYRQFSDGTGAWGPWRSLGGSTYGTPTTSCVGDFTAQPIVWVIGNDGALWRRTLTTGWQRQGGALFTEPSAAPAVYRVCPPAEDVVAIGGDQAVWERRAGAWSRVGGLSFYSPAILRLPSGVSYLFVIGTDNALYSASRASDGAAWSGFGRIGGYWTGPPSVQLYPDAPATLTVVALGGNQQVYRAQRVIGTPTWSFSQVP
jgi:hypothetical protein